MHISICTLSHADVNLYPHTIITNINARLAVEEGGLYKFIADAVDDISWDLSQVVTRWKHVGVLLGVKYSVLERISGDDNVEQNLRDTIAEWLNNCDTQTQTLQRLVEAVEHSAGGRNPNLARDIRDKHVG